MQEAERKAKRWCAIISHMYLKLEDICGLDKSKNRKQSLSVSDMGNIFFRSRRTQKCVLMLALEFSYHCSDQKIDGLSSDLCLEATVCEGATVLLCICLGWNDDADKASTWMQELRKAESIPQVNVWKFKTMSHWKWLMHYQFKDWWSYQV